MLIFYLNSYSQSTSVSPKVAPNYRRSTESPRLRSGREDAYRVGRRWVARRAENLAPFGTGSQSARVRNEPPSRKLPRARSRNPTFPAMGVSAAPCPAGVLRWPRATRAGAGPRPSTSRPSPTRPSDWGEVGHTERGVRRVVMGRGERRVQVDGLQLSKSCCPRRDPH